MNSLVKELIQPFLENNLSNYTVYFDIDDTLSDYSTNLHSFQTTDPDTGEQRSIKASDTPTNIDFWINASLIPGADKMVNFAKQNFSKVEILSAVPELSNVKKQETGERFYKAPIEGKTEWVKKHIGPIKFNWAKNGKEKTLYATPNSILIDDKLDNILNFEQQGGIGILFTNPSDVIKKLNQIIHQPKNIQEFVTQSELDNVEKIADEWFEDYGIDVQFTKHFIERINDTRNGKPISAEELEDLFTQTAEKYGEKLANLPDDYQAVLFKLRNDINLPFALNYDDRNDEMDLVAKTIMRKKNFQTSNPKLALEENYAEPSEYDYPKLIKSLTEYMLGKGMNIRPLPKVRFIKDDIENARNFFGKTAYYDPNNRIIVLYTMERHPKDIMRSFAHEMIHHMQNCEDRLGNITTQNTNEEGDLPEIEREAYEKGNMTFRNWTDTLTEGILSEGRYDKISNMISSDVLKAWKKSFEEGKPHSIKKFYYTSEEYDIEVTAKMLFIPGNASLFIDGSMDDQGEHLELNFRIGTNKLPEFWEEISMNLKDVVRHEIEHATQTSHDINQRSGKFMEDDTLIRRLIRAKMLPKSQYFKLEKEVDANLQGMYFRAKKEKHPFKDVINTYLDAQDITPEQKEEILDIWRNRLPALNLPKF